VCVEKHRQVFVQSGSIRCEGIWVWHRVGMIVC